MNAAVIYARVSSREQEQEGYSIPAQLKLLKEYAFKNGFKIEREFVDVESAKTTGRQSFGEMVEYLKGSKTCRTIFVEKTDRLYRNFRDAVTLEELDLSIHLVKENEIISKDSKSYSKFVHGIRVLMAKNYSDNLREEVKKGMAEKAEQGIFPGHAPFGYLNDRTERNIKPHPEESPIVRQIFELYASGQVTLADLRKVLKTGFGKTFSKGYLHRLIQNPFYIGFFEWGGITYRGIHAPIVSNELFQRVQHALKNHNRGKYGKHDIAFRGMLTCAHDDCTMTTEKKKGKYVYYRCSGYKGKCETPRFTEPEISEKLGDVLKGIYIPDDVLKRIVNALESTQERSKKQHEAEAARLAQRLATVRQKMDRAYDDKLSGAIDEAFWTRKMNDWRNEEQQIQMAIDGLKESKSSDRLLNAKRILELANKASFLYFTQNPVEQAKLLKMVLLNCAIDELSVYPTYRKPFDLIFERAKTKEWSGRADLNCRPLAPQASALPG
jgi:site-specific DNA recombinase